MLTDLITGLAESARATGAIGVMLFFVVYVLATVLVLPGSILTLAAGFAYGPLWGLAVASPASVAGATCAFVLGRTVLRRWAERKLAASDRARAIDAAVERDAFRLVLLLRLSPVIPFSVLNYVLSLSNVPLRTYVVASFIGMLPATALYVYLGSLVPAAAQLAGATSETSTAQMVLYAVGFVATVAVVVLGTRAARQALRGTLPGQTPA
jgi:uncharacterized membrane protein YdjX (TVP38/TMEM64 family)